MPVDIRISILNKAALSIIMDHILTKKEIIHIMKIGSHVSMSGKDMLLGSAKEAVSYGADTFMFYTGAPQNTRRKDISELNIDAAWEYMNAPGIDEIIVHAPYIINLGNNGKVGNLFPGGGISGKRDRRTISCRATR